MRWLGDFWRSWPLLSDILNCSCWSGASFHIYAGEDWVQLMVNKWLQWLSLLVSARCFLCPRPAIRRVAPICRWLGPSLPGTSGTWSVTRDSVQPGIRRGLYTVYTRICDLTLEMAAPTKEWSKVYPSSVFNWTQFLLNSCPFLMIHAL